MKRIGIDARLFSQTGVGTYLQNLLYYLDKENVKKNIYYIYLMENDFDKVNFKNKNIIKKITNFKWHTLAEQIGFLISLLKDNLDLVHFTYFSYPFFYPKKFIATVHDLTPMFFKTGQSSTKSYLLYLLKHFIYKIGMKILIKRSKKIIVPTASIAKQLKLVYKTDSEKIKVIYEGVNYRFFKEKENKELRKKFKNFFIYVGNFYPHKNVNRLIEAYRLLDIPNKLILIGPDDFFSRRLKKEIQVKKNNKNIIFYNNPSFSDMVFFYKNALAIIHPSLSEGFGLPIIEACYFNCPIIASKLDVFKEILGNNYISFDPYNVSDIKNKIEFFLKNKPKYNYKNILNKFSFKEMTKKTIKLYEEILNY